MSQFLPADFSQGDPNTVGGYRAVHGRPAALEGSDGASYSLEVVCDATGDRSQPFAAYLLFVRWRESDPVAVGHLETEYLGFGETETAATAAVDGLTVQAARAHLEALLSTAGQR